MRRVQAVGGRKAGTQLGPVFASEFASLGNGVENLCTRAGFSGDDGGVGVQGGREVVRVLLGDCWDVVDRKVKQPQVPVRAEAHVVHHLGGKQDAESFLAVAQGGQKGLPISVREPVVRRRVVDFSGVFHTCRPSLSDRVESVRPGSHVLGHGEHKAVDVERRSRLELAHKACAQRHLQRLVLPGVVAGGGPSTALRSPSRSTARMTPGPLTRPSSKSKRCLP